jgi:hypothetical protein
MSFVVAGTVIVGAGIGYMRADAAVDGAKNNLESATLQAVLYDTKATQVESAATIEASEIYGQAGVVSSQRRNTIAARGISVGSQLSEDMDEADLMSAKKSADALTASAFMESSSLRTQGRLDVSAAKSAVSAARKDRPYAIASSAVSFGMAGYGAAK